MLEVIREADGFYVIDPDGKKMNPKPFSTEKEAQGFIVSIGSGKDAAAMGLPPGPSAPMPGGPPMGGMPGDPPMGSMPPPPMGGLPMPSPGGRIPAKKRPMPWG